MSKRVEPSIAESAFNCPHCGALAAQRWSSGYAEMLPENTKTPTLPSSDIFERIEAEEELDEPTKETFRSYFRRAVAGEVFLHRKENGSYLYHQIVNLHLADCFNCHGFSVWVQDRLIHPIITHAGVEPNDDLDPDIKRDFLEARSIIDQSPRGAAALLRLALQKLCEQMGEPGKNIDVDIASLVGKGMNPLIQKALDVVRVVGNEAVHPGSLDLRDDRDTALKLLSLLNTIAQQMITHPKEVEALYGKLPEAKRAGIDVRNSRALARVSAGEASG